MAAGGGGNRHDTMGKVMVFNIPKSFTEDNLTTMFSHCGDVLFAQICRNKETHTSLGYGKVEFRKAADALKAIEEINGLQLGSNKIKVSFPEPVGEDIKNATKVKFNKLPRKYTEENIEDLFKKFGKIVHVRLVRDSVSNNSKCFGFVFFERQNDAENAVKALNGFEIEGAKNKLQVSIVATPRSATSSYQPYSTPRPVSRPIGPPRHQYGQSIPSYTTGAHTNYSTGGNRSFRVFVYNIGEHVTEQELYNIFAQFGGLVKIDIARNPQTNFCKGYAFLTFDSKAAAENAIFTIDGQMHRGKILQVRFKQD